MTAIDTVTIRRGREDDTAAMREITRDVWEGHDYVPDVWASWLDDDRGFLMVAELDGRMVGFQHIERQFDATAWFEGIRVDEHLQGRGIGASLLAAGVEWARISGCPAVRLSTASSNAASSRIAEKAGLRVIARFTPIRLDAPQIETESIGRIGRPDETEEVFKLLSRAHGAGLYTEGWTAYRLTPGRLRLLLAQGQVVVAGQDPIGAACIASANIKRIEPRPGLINGTLEGMAAIVRFILDSAASQRIETIRGQLPASDEDWPTYSQIGISRAWEHDMLVHELIF
jgi:GNAT superfamily N-acetyltransferase